MTRKRLLQTIRLRLIISSAKRVEYLRKHEIFGYLGKKVTFMDRNIPLYPKLIRIHDNVRIASNVTFATHDVTHFMLNNMPDCPRRYTETVGCIEIMDNVFIGTHVTIVGGVRIGPNAIVAAGAVVTKDVPPDSVVAGVPAKKISSLAEYIERREDLYPKELAPKHQEISAELVNYMWDKFHEAKKE